MYMSQNVWSVASSICHIVLLAHCTELRLCSGVNTDFHGKKNSQIFPICGNLCAPSRTAVYFLPLIVILVLSFFIQRICHYHQLWRTRNKTIDGLFLYLILESFAEDGYKVHHREDSQKKRRWLHFEDCLGSLDMDGALEVQDVILDIYCLTLRAYRTILPECHLKS